MKNRKTLILAVWITMVTYGLLTLTACNPLRNCSQNGRFIGYGSDTKQVLRHPLNRQYQ